MTLDNVISAAFALSRQDRERLCKTIAIADGLGVDIQPACSRESHGGVNWDAVDKLARPMKEGLERHANTRKAYTGEDLVALHEIASRMDTDCSFGEKQQREAIQQAAKRLGRTEKAIAEKIRTIRLS